MQIFHRVLRIFPDAMFHNFVAEEGDFWLDRLVFPCDFG
jgi:hypothetical protein